MKETSVVNVKVQYIRPAYANLKEWMADPENVYVGRAGVVFVDKARFPPVASPFANPFKIEEGVTREDVIAKYKDWLLSQPELVNRAKLELRGKTLGCWCKPEACHGDILAEIANSKVEPVAKLFYVGKDSYKKTPKYHWESSYVFTNFYECKKPFLLDGKAWRSTEAYFQAQKFMPAFPEYAELIRLTDKPSKTKLLGTQRQDKRFGAKWTLQLGKDDRLINDLVQQGKDSGVEIRPDWEDVKLDVMKRAIEAKFTQCDELKNVLTEKIADNEYLVEDSPRDAIWGVGPSGTGLNLLGKSLTGLRWKLLGRVPPTEMQAYIV